MAERDSGSYSEKPEDPKPVREIYTAYICARCDTDFGINDEGCNLKTGTYAMRCPICECTVLHVYHIVDDRETIGIKERGRGDRPPVVTDTREHLGEDTDENTETEW